MSSDVLSLYNHSFALLISLHNNGKVYNNKIPISVASASIERIETMYCISFIKCADVVQSMPFPDELFYVSAVKCRTLVLYNFFPVAPFVFLSLFTVTVTMGTMHNTNSFLSNDVVI